MSIIGGAVFGGQEPAGRSLRQLLCMPWRCSPSKELDELRLLFAAHTRPATAKRISIFRVGFRSSTCSELGFVKARFGTSYQPLGALAIVYWADRNRAGALRELTTAPYRSCCQSPSQRLCRSPADAQRASGPRPRHDLTKNSCRAPSDAPRRVRPAPRGGGCFMCYGREHPHSRLGCAAFSRRRAGGGGRISPITVFDAPCPPTGPSR
jgi:hypothetical protein